MQFTGLFNVMSHHAYAKDFKGRSAMPGFEDINLSKWKSIGTESLTLVRMARKDRNSVRVEFRTADIHRDRPILGKAYLIKHEEDFRSVAKTYIDRMLEAYTNRPGIFSTRIVLIGRRTKASTKQVFTCDPDGGNLRQITSGPRPHLSPSWSPDGKSVLFTSYEAGNPDLYKLRLSDRKKWRVSGHRGINSGGVFSANGKIIAFTGSYRGNAEIFVTDGNAVKPRRELLKGRGIDVDPVFSPDGRWLAFVSGRFGNPHIFRAQLRWNADETAVQVIGDKRLTYAGWYNATPAWSPNSQKISFAGYDKDINRFDIFLMNHDGTQLERLTIRAGDNENPSWSPNGQLIMFHSNRIGTQDIKGRSQIYIMNKDGTEQRQIETGLYDAQTPKWGPLPTSLGLTHHHAGVGSSEAEGIGHGDAHLTLASLSGDVVQGTTWVHLMQVCCRWHDLFRQGFSQKDRFHPTSSTETVTGNRLG